MLDYFESEALQYHTKSSRGLWGLFKKKELQSVDQLLSPSHNASLLDIGCGPGIYADYFQKKYALDVTALDRSPAMITEVLRINDKIKATVQDAGDLTKLQQKFQSIIALGMLEFNQEAQSFFNATYDLLETNGKMVILFPNDGMIGKIYKFWHERRQCNVTIRSIDDYNLMARKAGFQVIELRRPTCLSVTVLLMKK